MKKFLSFLLVFAILSVFVAVAFTAEHSPPQQATQAAVVLSDMETTPWIAAGTAPSATQGKEELLLMAIVGGQDTSPPTMTVSVETFYGSINIAELSHGPAKAKFATVYNLRAETIVNC